MKKIFTLLTLLLTIVGGANSVLAADYTWTFDGYCTDNSISADSNADIAKSATTVVATSNGVNLSFITGNNSNSRIYNLSSAASVGGTDYNSYLYMGGSGSSAPGNGNLRYFATGTISGKGTLTVVYAGTVGGTCYIYDGTSATATSSALTSITPAASSAVTSSVIDCGEGKSLAICHSAKCYIYAIIWTGAAAGPSFTLTTPATNTNVAIKTSVELTANEDITAVGGSIAGTIKAGDAEATAITFTRSGRVLTYTPASALSYNTTYVVKLNANQVQNGESVKNAEQSFSFKTMVAPVTTANNNEAATGATYYANNSNATPALPGSGVNSITFAGVCTLDGSNMQNGSVAYTIGGHDYTSFKVAKSTYTITPAPGVEINSVKLYIKSNDNSNTVKVTTGTSATETETVNKSATNPTEIDLEKDGEGKFCFTVVNSSATNQAIIVLAINYDRIENMDVSVSFAGYATLFHDKNLTVPAGVTAYKAAVSGSNIVLTDIGALIPANTGVILKADAGIYNFMTTTADASGVDVSGNILSGTISATTKAVLGGTVYTLGQDAYGDVGLRNYTGTDIRAYSAYATSIAGARDFYGFSFEDEATGVNEVRGKKEEGRDEFYNLAGQRVAQPTKGLYIVNGKKVIVK